METFIKLSKDTIKRIVTTEEVIDLKPLREELSKIENDLKILDEQPDEILTPNENKYFMIRQLDARKKELNTLLKNAN